MTALNLTLSGLADGGPPPAFATKMLHILQDFLRPRAEKSATLKATAQAVLKALPDVPPHAGEIYKFGSVCQEVAEQIPYHHPAQLKSRISY